MPHGTPDWHAWDTSQLLYKSIDPAESAVRLGAVPSVDRMGQVLSWDNFANGLGDWTGYMYTPTRQVTLKAAMARSAGYCVRLWWNDEEDPRALIHTERDYPLPGRVGLECYFHPYMSQGIYWLSGYLRTGGQRHRFGIRWRYVAVGQYVIEVDAAVAGWTPVLNVNFTYGFRRTWRCLKVVLDMTTHMYVRGWWGALTVPMSTQPMAYINSIVEPHLDIDIGAYGLATQEGECLVDDFVVTTYEP